MMNRLLLVTTAVGLAVALPRQSSQYQDQAGHAAALPSQGGLHQGQAGQPQGQAGHAAALPSQSGQYLGQAGHAAALPSQGGQYQGQAGLAAALPTQDGQYQGQAGHGHHRGQDGHDEACVDISRYSDLLYNTTQPELCTYTVTQKCEQLVSQVCAAVPVTRCHLTPGPPECTQTAIETKIVRNDKIEQQQFTSKACRQAGLQTISQTVQRPVCQTVTRPISCESKWVLNDLGEKVWDGNENCESATAEECHLEDYLVPVEVPIWSCQDDQVFTYEAPVVGSQEVTIYASQCQPTASPVCSTVSEEQQCIEVSVENCVDVIVPQCQASQQTFQIPYQIFDHRLKCLV
jgi:hypothetical protein